MAFVTQIETAYPASTSKAVAGGRRAYQQWFEVAYADGAYSDRLATAAEAIAEAKALMQPGEHVEVRDQAEALVWSS